MFLINRNFCLLWLGQLISQAGDKAYAVILVWWLVEKTASPSSVGLLLMTSMLPEILASPLAGVYVDRWNRRLILAVSDFLRGTAVMAVAVLHSLGQLEVWHIFITAFIISISAAFFNPATMAIIPQLVKKDDLQKANSLSQTVSGGVSVAGPLLGTAMVGLAGYSAVFWFNALSYLFSGLMALFLRTTQESDHPCHSIQDSILAGFRYILADRSILTLLVIIALVHAFIGSLLVSLPLLAGLISPDGMNSLGILQSMIGGGMMAGGLLMQKTGANSRKSSRLYTAILLAGFGMTLLGLLLTTGIRTVLPFAAAIFAVGICIAVASVIWRTSLQLTVPTELRGRVFSSVSATGNVSLPLAAGICGALLDVLSVQSLLLVSGMILGLYGLMLLVRLAPHPLHSD